MAIYKARDFDQAFDLTRAIYDYQGKGHSVGIHTRDDGSRMLGHLQRVLDFR